MNHIKTRIPTTSGWVIHYHWTRVLADACARVHIVQHYHRPLGTLGAPALLAQLAFDRAYRTRAVASLHADLLVALDQMVAPGADALDAPSDPSLDCVTVPVRRRPSARQLASLDANGFILIIATRGVIRAVFVPLSVWSAFWRATATSCVPSPFARLVMDLLYQLAARAERKTQIQCSQN